MSEKRPIVAYLFKGAWYTAKDVDKARVSDKGAYMDAAPHTVASLRNRREYGRDVPEWIDLDNQDNQS